MHGDSGDGRWFHPEDMADPAPPSFFHLRTDVVLLRLSSVALNSR